MIPAHSAIGAIDRPLDGPVGDQGTGCGRRRAAARPECPIPRPEPRRARGRVPDARKIHPGSQLGGSGVPAGRLPRSAIFVGSPVDRPSAQDAPRTANSTSSTSIRRSWPSEPVWRCARCRARSRPRIVVTEHNVWSSHSRLTRLADRADRGPVRDPPRGVGSGPRLAARLDPGPHPGDPVRRRRRRAPARGRAPGRAAPPARDRRRRDRDRHGRQSPGDEGLPRPARGRPRGRRPGAERRGSSRSAAARWRTSSGPGTASSGSATRFTFLGYRPDAVRVMSAFDVFCLPSHYEGLPIALMEALALGLPVVATKVGGVAELVTDGEDAVLVPAGEPDAAGRGARDARAVPDPAAPSWAPRPGPGARRSTRRRPCTTIEGRVRRGRRPVTGRPSCAGRPPADRPAVLALLADVARLGARRRRSPRSSSGSTSRTRSARRRRGSRCSTTRSSASARSCAGEFDHPDGRARHGGARGRHRDRARPPGPRHLPAAHDDRGRRADGRGRRLRVQHAQRQQPARATSAWAGRRSGRLPLVARVARRRRARCACARRASRPSGGRSRRPPAPTRRRCSPTTGSTTLLASLGPPAGFRTTRTAEYLRWRYGLAALGYRAIALDDDPAPGSRCSACAAAATRWRPAIVRGARAPRLRGTRAPPAATAVARETGADYAVRLGRPAVRGRATCRSRARARSSRGDRSPTPSAPPTVRDLDFALGDVELL